MNNEDFNENLEVEDYESVVPRYGVDDEELVVEPVKSTARKTLVQLAKEVRNGDWGNDEEEQREALGKAGYNGSRVLKEASLQEKGSDISVDALANAVNEGAWGSTQEAARNLQKAGHAVSTVLAEAAARLHI